MGEGKFFFIIDRPELSNFVSYYKFTCLLLIQTKKNGMT